MIEPVDVGIELLRGIEFFDSTSPVQEALRGIQEVTSPFLRDLEASLQHSDRDHIKRERDEIVRTANGMWPWLDRQVMVDGSGVAAYFDQQGGEQLEPLTLSEQVGQSKGFAVNHDDQAPEGTKLKLYHVLGIDVQKLKGESIDHRIVHMTSAFTGLDRAVIEPLDYLPPVNNALLEDACPELFADVSVAIDSGSTISQSLRNLSEVDYSPLASMPKHVNRELIRYLMSQKLLVPNHPYRFGRAYFATHEELPSGQASDYVIPGERVKLLDLVAQMGRFTLVDVIAGLPGSRVPTNSPNIAVRVSVASSEGQLKERVIPLHNRITVKSLWRGSVTD